MYQAKNVAEYILGYYGSRGTKIDNYKLQEVLYYLQANYLVLCHDSLFAEPIIAKEFGPIVEPVYSKYREYGNCTIPYKLVGINTYNKKIQKKDQKIVNTMLNLLEPYLAINADESRKGQIPWIEAYHLSKEDRNPEKAYIKTESLLKCFGGAEKEQNDEVSINMIKDELKKIVEMFCDEDGNITLTEEMDEMELYIKTLFEDYNIPFTISNKEMFDGHGMDTYSYAIAWVEDGKPNLMVYKLLFE